MFLKRKISVLFEPTVPSLVGMFTMGVVKNIRRACDLLEIKLFVISVSECFCLFTFRDAFLAKRWVEYIKSCSLVFKNLEKNVFGYILTVFYITFFFLSVRIKIFELKFRIQMNNRLENMVI